MRLRIQRNGDLTILEHGEEERPVGVGPIDLAACFRALVELEDGLTTAQLMRALKPWSSLIGCAAWMEFDEWLAAGERPHLALARAASGDAADGEPPLDAVVVHPVLSFHSTGRRQRGPTTVNIRWRVSGRYARPRPDGHGGKDSFCSLSFSPPAEWAHLPLILDGTLMVDALVSKADAGLEAALEASQLVADPTFFGAIILGFLDDISFHGSPSETQEQRQELLSRLDDVKEGRAGLQNRSRQRQKLE
jgi:hypothetical protein